MKLIIPSTKVIRLKGNCPVCLMLDTTTYCAFLMSTPTITSPGLFSGSKKSTELGITVHVYTNLAFSLMDQAFPSLFYSSPVQLVFASKTCVVWHWRRKLCHHWSKQLTMEYRTQVHSSLVSPFLSQQPFPN